MWQGRWDVRSGLAVAGDITVGVLTPADIARGVTVGVAPSAVAASPAVFVDHDVNVTVGVTYLADPVDVITDSMTYQEKNDVMSGSLCDYDNYFYDAQYDDDSPD